MSSFMQRIKSIGTVLRNRQRTTESHPLQRIRRRALTSLGLLTFSLGLGLDRLRTQLERLMSHLPALGRVLMTLLTSPLSLMRGILGVQFLTLLRALLIVLSGSLYLSIVGFIFYGAYWIAINENIYLGIIVGMFFFSVLTLGLALLIMSVLGRVRNDSA